jgi:hypothetical protein
MRPTRRLSFYHHLGLDAVADAIAAVVGFLWRLFVVVANAALRAGGWSELDLARGFAVSVVREFGEALYDYGGSTYNLRHPQFACLGNGVADDTAGMLLAVAKANTHQLTVTTDKSAIGATITAPQGQYRCTSQLAPFPGVMIKGVGMHSSVIIFEMATTTDAVVFDVATAGFTAHGGFGYGGGLRDIKLCAKSYLVNGQTCGIMLRVRQCVFFQAENVAIIGSYGRNLKVDNCISSAFRHCWFSTSNGDCGVWVGGDDADVSNSCTTTRFFDCYQTVCAGVGWKLSGIAIELHSCIAESNGSYGVEIRYGTVTLNAMYCEDNASHDIYVGSVAYPGGARTVVSLVNPILVLGVAKPGLGGIYADRVDNLTVTGGAISVAPKPFQMTANCGEVVISSDFGLGGAVPELTYATGSQNWRAKKNLTWVNHSNRTIFKDKSGVTQTGTAVLTLPTRTGFAPAMRVWFEVYYTLSNDLRAIGYIDVVHDGDSNTDGDKTVSIISNDTSGNFRVQSSDFTVSFAAAGTIVITYTNSNLAAQTNYIDFQIPATESLDGEPTIA